MRVELEREVQPTLRKMNPLELMTHDLKREIGALTRPKLIRFAENMGVKLDFSRMNMEEIVDACLASEQYTFTH